MTRFQAASREAWVFVLVSLAVLLGVATFSAGEPATADERMQSLADQYACPTCKGQSVAESNAAVASTIREFIRTEVNAGATDTQIRDALVRAYGEGVLLNPPATGWNALIWILPVLVLVGGFGIVGSSILATRNRSGSTEPSAEDAALVEQLRAERR